MAGLTDQARTMLSEGKNFASLSTLMQGGSPQASVVWVDTDGEHVVFNTAAGRLKDRNVRRDPKVAFALFNPENMYEQVVIRGRVVDITAEGADDHIDRLAMKYLGQDKYPFRAPGEERLIVKVAVDACSGE